MKNNPATIRAAADALRQKEISARELTEHYISQIEQQDAAVEAYLEVYQEEALAQADHADALIADGAAGSLTGIPIAIKDLIMVAGKRCTAGSRMLENYTATYDAHVINQLNHGGAVLLGKTSLDEFAMGSSNEQTPLKKTKNPWDTSRVPGGSSGGSAAAVAADMCIAALGTDTGGSVRQPASFCGVVGFKPTYGSVSRHGVMAMTSSLDQVGPLAKTVEDAALLFNAISGHDVHDATTRCDSTTINIEKLADDITGIKIGVPKEYFVSGMDREVEKAIRTAIDQLANQGAEIVEVSLPLTKYALAVYQLTATSEISSNMARYDGIRYGHHAAADTLADTYAQSRAEGLGSEVKRRVMLGTFTLSSGYHDQFYAQAQRVRVLIQQEFANVFQEVDVLVGPTSPSVAFKRGEKQADPLQMYLSDIFTVPANLGGVCAVSVPAGFSEQMPIGLQFIAKAFDEQTLLQVAHQYEQNTEWHTQHPPLD